MVRVLLPSIAFVAYPRPILTLNTEHCPGSGGGAGVGSSVGLGVGFGVGFGVGLGVGFGVGFGVGLGVGFGVGFGVGVETGHTGGTDVLPGGFSLHFILFNSFRYFEIFLLYEVTLEFSDGVKHFFFRTNALIKSESFTALSSACLQHVIGVFLRGGNDCRLHFSLLNCDLYLDRSSLWDDILELSARLIHDLVPIIMLILLTVMMAPSRAVLQLYPSAPATKYRRAIADNHDMIFLFLGQVRTKSICIDYPEVRAIRSVNGDDGTHRKVVPSAYRVQHA